jgi:4-hydroxy-3-methylbut-2-enyl diphosphate reductase
MTVTVAKTAGFCFGVQRAVRMVEEKLAEDAKLATLGPIIHNPQMVERLAEQGARKIGGLEEAGDSAVVICSHGVGRDVYHDLENNGIEYIDATCPDVRKIQRFAGEQSALGRAVLVAGEREHPEIRGIVSNCGDNWRCFSGLAELEALWREEGDFSRSGYAMLFQTTFPVKEWKKCRDFAENVYTNLFIFDTICRATVLRQEEADKLSKDSDLMIVIGGAESSNTAKLARICEQNCRTLLIERPRELLEADFAGAERIGVTAGASTPAFIIKEVLETMSDVMNQPEEMSFEEMLDQSFKPVNNREKVTAIVTNVSASEIGVDLGTKHAGYVPLSEFTDDPTAKLEQLVKVGDELELLVLRVNDVEGTALLSKKRLDAIAGFEKVMAAAETEEILEGTVVDVVKGGVIALTNGVRVFIPASQATMSRGQELETLLRQPVSFRILEVNRSRRRAVGSIRAVLREQRRELEEKFWETAAAGNIYTGAVKSLTSYGAFVDLGGVDGMIHISELSWSRIKHPSEVVKVGDVVEVYVREIDPESKKISLGYKKNEENPWEILKKDFKIGDAVNVKIVSMTPFGAFARVIPGVDGLIHISQISTERVAKPQDALEIGQDVDVRITDIDFEKKRVSLSIRALLEENQAAREEEQSQDSGGVVYEAAPPAAPAVEGEAPAIEAEAEETEAGAEE